MLSELEVIERVLIDEGHGVVADDAPTWAHRLDEACNQVRDSMNDPADPGADWGDVDDMRLAAEDERDVLAARLADVDRVWRSGLEHLAGEIRAHLNWPDRDIGRSRLFDMADALAEQGF